MSLFWEKYYPWARKVLCMLLFISMPLYYLADIDFPKSLLMIMILILVLFEIVHFYLATNLD